MSTYTAEVLWQRAQHEVFTDNKYCRAHQWKFDGGVIVPASPSPHIVPAPFSEAANVDPEEAYIASLSSCHMLFFLHLAAKANFVVDEYLDSAIGELGKDNHGKVWMTRVLLRPRVSFANGQQPSISELESLHHQAHEQCFIANSVKTAVVTEIIS